MGGSTESHGTPPKRIFPSRRLVIAASSVAAVPTKEVDQTQEISAGSSAYTIGDGAAQGNAPNSGWAEDRQQRQCLRDAALHRAEGDGGQYQ